MKDKEKQNSKKNTGKRSLFIRGMCIFLCFLMILGIITMLLGTIG